jgi:hypothetical protein
VEAMSEPSVAPEDLIGYLENAAEIFKGKVIYPIS